MKNKTESTNLAYQDALTDKGTSYSEEKLNAIQLPSLAGKRFLDLGCNAGFYCGKALEYGATRVLGIDLDPKIIRIAREKHPSAEFADGGWDRFPDEVFDIAICLSAIHYAKDFHTLASNIHSHLSKDGLFILEGGLLDPEGQLFTDIPIPVWRKVGDRCRHLSHGFLKRHLLREFDWKILGSSVAKGGDPIARFLIHAAPGKPSTAREAFQVDLVEYAQCLALSAETISPAMPSFAYIRQLGACGHITRTTLASLLADSDAFSSFVDDLAFAIGSQRPATVRLRGLENSILIKLCRALEKQGIYVEGAPGTLKCISAYIKHLEIIPNNLDEGKLTGKTVAVFGSPDAALAEAILEKGALRCYVAEPYSNASQPDDEQILPLIELDKLGSARVDVAFFDIRSSHAFNSVEGIHAFLEQAQKRLKPDGTLFCILQSGNVNPNIDCVNSVVMTGQGPMPSSAYLFDSLLADFSVRTLESAIETESGVLTRLMRLRRKKPSLLLVFAPSQSGKTTLARDLKARDQHSHISNDYIFFEMVRLKAKGMLDWIPTAIKEFSDGSDIRTSCGQFNRSLETDHRLLKDYLELVASLIPRDKQLASIDLDLRDPKIFTIAKDFFAAKGYSVWVVTR